VSEPATLLSCVERFMADIGQDAAGVVAVSGGADSVALLRALLSLPRPGRLIIAHLNHALRGAESDADEAFVRNLHGTLLAAEPERLLLRCERIDVAARARAEGENLESTARQIRYEWLTAVAQQVGACWVATGHTADDQAETVLHRLVRGSGLRGLCGIPPRRDLAPGIQVLRPLLRVRRQEVLAFLEMLPQDYRQDSSNADPGFTRNRIRHELLPHLAAGHNPAIVSVLCRLAEQAAEVQQDQEAQAARLLHAAELPRAGAMVVLDATRLAQAARHQVREMFRLVWRREGWPQGRLGFDDWDRLAHLAVANAEAALDVAGGVRVRRCGRVVQLQAER
jgi:tRNA(Ile)-lysidine synthase